MTREVRTKTDALAVTAQRAASLMLNEHDLTDGDTLPRACTLICEALIGCTGGDLNVMPEVIAMLLDASAKATTNGSLARLAPPPQSAS